MATRLEQPELPRRVSVALLVALSGALLASPARGQYRPSGYEPVEGEPFFLLSDKAWGSGEVPLVRLETSSQFGLSAIEEYGGVDVVLYRVPHPLEFLEAQKNLHRVKTDAVQAEEGLSNTLAHLWDRWYEATRRAWQKVFSAQARKAVTSEAPELKTKPVPPTPFRQEPQFRPLPGFELVTRFRYAVHHAAPVKPPAGVSLEGSSSAFLPSPEGKVMIPLGRVSPGLYLVEAYAGSCRANTLVFVSDTIAITKASSSEMVVFAAERLKGTPVAGVTVAWTDGAGVLGSGKTSDEGLLRLSHEAPERSYVMGVDADGGAFISENFYYDSEIYGTKLYAFTDRPLYRPGDTVFLKVLGRVFRSSNSSAPLEEGDLDLVAFDPNGVPAAHQRLHALPDSGGDTSFRLPESSEAGGWQVKISYKKETYAAAFRVAEYNKPHFEVVMVPDKSSFKVGESVTGRLQLRYADGAPVVSADIELSVRSQQMTMVDGEIGYLGQFPVKLDSTSLTTDKNGDASFALPPVQEPSRYILTALATDGSASRVRTSRELLVERAQSSFALAGERQWSAPGESLTWKILPLGQAPAAQEGPRAWEWVRLEDRQRAAGPLDSQDKLTLSFSEGGSYTVQLRDGSGNVVAAVSHWVSGGSVPAPQGSIRLVPSRSRYLPGETAEVLITFPSPVEEALLTLEGDRVEDACLLTRARGRVKASRITPTQWRALVPITAALAPSITFSVAYVRDGDYVFQNQGLTVVQPRVDVALHTDKAVYAPGETVTVDLRTTVDGKGRPALVSVGVVDEMVYVLQPEIAPTIDEFFYHLRRNNVRTASSQSFISYDLASSRRRGAPSPGTVSERRVKILERPRRDEVDTAFWQPALKTDPGGHARISFVVPDALTRWRVTSRALTADGVVGQRTGYFRSEKALYLKWTSPTWKRHGDAPVATLAVFNETTGSVKADLAVSGGGLDRHEELDLRPGITVVPEPIGSLSGPGPVKATLLRGGKVADALETTFADEPLQWRGLRTARIELAQGGATPLTLPDDTRDVRVRFVSSTASEIARIADDLLDYPYGCVEQTSSRMIPLALALDALGGEGGDLGARLRQQLNGHRLRLSYMAGPKAAFTWWGVFTADDPFLTPYAYYADFLSVRALGLSLPREHWNRLLDFYGETGQAMPLAQRAAVLNFMQDMGLPVSSLTGKLAEDLEKAPAAPKGGARTAPGLSPLVADPTGPLAQNLSLLLLDRLLKAQAVLPSVALKGRIDAAAEALRRGGTPLGGAMLLATGRSTPEEMRRVLATLGAEAPTMERAVFLAWIRGLQAPPGPGGSEAALGRPWQRSMSEGGSSVWRWTSPAPPRNLEVPGPIPPGTTAVVQYTSAESSPARLPIGLQRRFYRLTKPKSSEEGWQAEAVDDGAFSAKDLYLDEITVSGSDKPSRYAILEAPLPPGAAVESTTWGISLVAADGKLLGLERARHQPTPFGYAVPVDPVVGVQRIRHLVRFGEKGDFSLPSSRLFHMYDPEAKAYEQGASVRMTVR